MVSNELPEFKYHPDPLSTGVFVESKTDCPVCKRNNGYQYVGPFYSVNEVEGICPWCIKSGEAADKYDLTFVNEDEIEAVDDESLIEELTKRTPGYFFPQEDSWPVHCGDFCILIGGADSVDIKSKLVFLKNDLERIRSRLEITDEVLKKDLLRKNSPLWAGLFKCGSCEVYRLVADYE